MSKNQRRHEPRIVLPGDIDHSVSRGAGAKHKTWWRTIVHTLDKRPDLQDVGLMPHVLQALKENA